MARLLSMVTIALFVSACSPEVGSEDWCEDLDEKNKGDWTLDETAEYAKSCVL